MKSQIANRKSQFGFTLIELLVVITIIVVLLALLVPALDKAIYQAELAVCGARIKSIAAGVQVYATAHQRHYPYRATVWEGGWKRPNWLASVETGVLVDDRPRLAGYVDMKAMLDPLNGEGKIDLSVEATDADSHVLGNYAMWWDWRYENDAAGSTRSGRLGQRFSWGGQSYSVLVGDWDLVSMNRGTHSGHPDADGAQWFDWGQNLSNAPAVAPAPGGSTGLHKFTYSRWNADPTHARGAIDGNYAFHDGSVLRLDAVGWEDWRTTQRTVRVPYNTVETNTASIYVQVPVQ